MDRDDYIRAAWEMNWPWLVEAYGPERAVDYLTNVCEGMHRNDAALKTIDELASGKRCLVFHEASEQLLVYSNITGH